MHVQRDEEDESGQVGLWLPPVHGTRHHEAGHRAVQPSERRHRDEDPRPEPAPRLRRLERIPGEEEEGAEDGEEVVARIEHLVGLLRLVRVGGHGSAPPVESTPADDEIESVTP